MLRRLLLISVAGLSSAFGQPVNIPGASAALGSVHSLAVDPKGNVFIPLFDFHIVVRLDAMTGILSLVAGNGSGGFSGDNGPATSAQLYYPEALALDPAGNLFIADAGNTRLRKVSNGVITTVAGNGLCCFAGDNGPATSAQLDGPGRVAVDSAGNLYIADKHRVRKVSSGVITTVAGNGSPGISGDNGPATSAQLNSPVGIAVDADGNLYIADTLNHRIRKISAGVITTIAGNGSGGFSGDNGPAITAELKYPYGIALDSAGNLYIADEGDCRVRKIASGVITTVVGSATCSYGNGNGPALSVQLNVVYDVAVDAASNLYVLDAGQFIYKASNGLVTAIAGNGREPSGVGRAVRLGPNLTFVRTQYGEMGSSALAAGDFNGDGTPDLVTVGCDQTSNIYLLDGNGDGTFKPSKAIDTGKTVCGTSGGGQSIAVGDVNRDGKLDVVVTVTPTGSPLGSVVLLTGRGDGTFNPPVFVIPQRLQADYVTLADLNGDGILDLVSAVRGQTSNSGSVSISLGNGDGTFTLFESEPMAGVQSQIAIADFNGDNLPDIAVNSSLGVISVLLRKPTTTFPMFQPAILMPVGRSGESAEFAVADFNHDGLTDIAVPVWPGAGSTASAQLPDRVAILLGNGAFQRNDMLLPASPGYIGAEIAVADFDSDGRLDVVVGYHLRPGADNIFVMFGKGDGSFQPPDLGYSNYTFRTSGSPRQAIIGDFNADGRPDFATASGEDIRVWLNTTIAVPAITSAPTTLDATVGVPFRYQITAKNNPTSYTVIGLPPGLTYDSRTGLISGTPTVAQSVVLKISASNSAGTSAVVTVSMSVNPPVPAVTAPMISGVVGAAGSVPAVTRISPGGLATVYGTNFAPAGTSRQVQANDLAGGSLPPQLAGVCISFNAGPTSIGSGGLTYVSPTQVNFQVPNLPLNTSLSLVLSTSCGTANAQTAVWNVTTDEASPEFLYWVKNANGQNPVVALNSVTGVYVAPPGLITGASFTPVRAGDYLTIYGISFGPTTPAVTPGTAPVETAATTNAPVVMLGTALLEATNVLYAGVSPGTPGLYQLNIRVPDGLTDGEYSLSLRLGAYTTPAGGYITVRNVQANDASFEQVILPAGGWGLQPKQGSSPSFTFPTGYAGWGFAGNSGVTLAGSAYRPPNNFPDGVKAGILQGNGAAVSQAVSGLTPSVTYTVALYVGTRIDGGTYDGNTSVSVSVDGDVIGTTGLLPSDSPFSRYSFTFKVNTPGSHVLSISNAGPRGDHTAFVDSVSIIGAVQP